MFELTPMKFLPPPYPSGTVTQVLNSQNTERRDTFGVNELALDFDGIPGNRHYGQTKGAGPREKHYTSGSLMANNRHWSAVSEEELSAVAEIMGISDLDPGWVGANIVVEGIPGFSQLPLVSHLFFERDGKTVAVLGVYEHNGPCTWPDPYIAAGARTQPKVGFAKAGYARRGLVGWVDLPGTIQAGDSVHVRIPQLTLDPAFGQN